MAYGALYMVCCQAYVTICLFYNTTQQLSTRTDTVAQLSQKRSPKIGIPWPLSSFTFGLFKQ